MSVRKKETLGFLFFNNLMGIYYRSRKEMIYYDIIT
nr:MAG TPA: hypothetical protein [Caudoviricetes sp.]